MRKNGRESSDYINKVITAPGFVVLQNVYLIVLVGQGLLAFVFKL